MIKKAGLDIDLSLDRKKALKDTDFVITQLRVGLLDEMLEVHKKYLPQFNV